LTALDKEIIPQDFALIGNYLLIKLLLISSALPFDLIIFKTVLPHKKIICTKLSVSRRALPLHLAARKFGLSSILRQISPAGSRGVLEIIQVIDVDIT